ncbi:MAG: hypothetical protein WCW47_03005 [Candidatus Paceibacterota bacterium]|jgi:hypothetical protein
MEPPPFIIPALPNFMSSFFSTTPILPIVLGLFFVLYVIVSAALIYHWSEYGMYSAKVILAETTFVIVSVTLFVISTIALNYY